MLAQCPAFAGIFNLQFLLMILIVLMIFGGDVAVRKGS